MRPVLRPSSTVASVLATTGACAAALACALAGCQSLRSTDKVLGIVTPYKVEIVQGNVITQEQATRLKEGMSRAQVRDVLGSPLLTDVFHADRWDYVFTIRRQGAPPQDHRVRLTFAGDTLKTIVGTDDLPAEREFVASIDTHRTTRAAPVLELTPDEIKALPAPKADAAALAASAGLPASATVTERRYPPLEPR